MGLNWSLRLVKPCFSSAEFGAGAAPSVGDEIGSSESQSVLLRPLVLELQSDESTTRQLGECNFCSLGTEHLK